MLVNFASKTFRNAIIRIQLVIRVADKINVFKNFLNAQNLRIISICKLMKVSMGNINNNNTYLNKNFNIY